MAAITLQEAQKSLPDLIHRLSPGEEVVITENNKPVARLLASSDRQSPSPRKLGTMQGTVLHMSADFDAPLEDFQEYME
jgi:prevent-host-death family protein